MKGPSCLIYVALIAALVCLQGCNTSVSSKIERFVSQNKEQVLEGDSVRIAFIELTDFEWDSLFVFDDYSSNGEMERVAKINLDQYEDLYDDEDRFIFIKDRKAVHIEDFYAVVGLGRADTFKDAHFLIYTPETAVFNLKQECEFSKLYQRNDCWLALLPIDPAL